MPTLTVDDTTATALRQCLVRVDLIDANKNSLGQFLPFELDSGEAEIRREWIARMAQEFPPELLDQIELEPTHSMAAVMASLDRECSQ